MYHLVIREFREFKTPPPFSFFCDSMDSIITKLTSQQVWEEFLAYRLKKGKFNWREFEQTDTFVEAEQYLPLVNSIIEGGGLSIPQKRVVNKRGTNKKRVVYSFYEDEMTLLKLLAHMLYKYDGAFANNCYAFRRGVRASDAVRRLYSKVRGKGLWAYKLDIQNYFNSISVPILLPLLKDLLADDKMLYDFFERVLTDDRCISGGEVVVEQKGVMAGVPLASFLANVYLNEVDHYFADRGVIYARYSDDIILFAEDLETLQLYRAKMMEFIAKYNLEVNPTKERIYTPEEPYEFLGFKCGSNHIDISESGVEKMKGKIRRKMRALLRWKKRKGHSAERAMASLINYFNRKFYDTDLEDTLTWSRWYFPVITSSESLRIIDQYLQQSIRALATGRHNKSNYRITYEHLKQLGYRSLVHEYYKQREQRGTMDA